MRRSGSRILLFPGVDLSAARGSDVHAWEVDWSQGLAYHTNVMAAIQTRC